MILLLKKIWNVSKTVGLVYFGFMMIWCCVLLIPSALWSLITRPIHTITTLNSQSGTLLMVVGILSVGAVLDKMGANWDKIGHILKTAVGIIFVPVVLSIPVFLIQGTIAALSPNVKATVVGYGISVWQRTNRQDISDLIIAVAIVVGAIYLSSHLKLINSRLDNLERIARGKK